MIIKILVLAGFFLGFIAFLAIIVQVAFKLSVAKPLKPFYERYKTNKTFPPKKKPLSRFQYKDIVYRRTVEIAATENSILLGLPKIGMVEIPTTELRFTGKEKEWKMHILPLEMEIHLSFYKEASQELPLLQKVLTKS